MPLNPGSSRSIISNNIREFHTGKTYAHTAAKFGKERANKQAIAVALSEARRHPHAAFGGGVQPISLREARSIAEKTQREYGGVVPHRDTGGGVDPVQAVINALQSGAGGTAGVASASYNAPTTGNSSQPSSTTATTATSPPAANTTSGVAPAATGTSNATTSAVTPQTTTTTKAHGGALQRQSGGFNMAKGPNLRPPWFERSEARQLHVGPVLSNVPGRTDNHRVKVPAGSYVLPAAHVASMGHGNTLAGMSLASKMFGGPYGAPAMKPTHGHTMPKPPSPPHGGFGSSFGRTPGVPGFLYGGHSEGGARGVGQFQPVDVDISGGEFVIPPWAIIAKFGSLKAGHKILDKWIMDLRKKEIETQKKLPPPAKRWLGGSVGLELALAA